MSPALTPSPQLLAGLDTDQRAALTHQEGPLLIVAGPGSGKTLTLTRRIAALLEGGTPPTGILAVTFTNKAAAEMRTRLADLVGPAAQKLWVATFHSACLTILRNHAPAARLSPAFTIADADTSHRLITDAAGRTDPELTATDIRRIAQLISTTKNDGAGPAALTARDDPLAERAATVMRTYQQGLNRMHMVDFDDLLIRTLWLLTTRTDIAARYQQRLEHVIVDEWQDSNRVQLQLTRILASHHRNVCCCGDHDQGIYSWRGATQSALARFQHDWPDASLVVLRNNYRSTEPILETCRAIIAPNRTSHRSPLVGTRPGTRPVTLFEAADDREEATWVTDRLASHTQAGQQAAVIVRTNAQMRLFEEELVRRRLRYEMVGGTRFYERAEVKDLLSYLFVATNPADVVAFRRSATTPRRGLGPSTLDQVAAAAAGGSDLVAAATSLATTDQLPPARARALAGYLETVGQVQAAVERGPREAVAVALESSGLVEMFTGREEQDRLANLGEVVSAARQFEAVDPDVGQVLEGRAATVAYLAHLALAAGGEEHPEGGEGGEREPVVLTTAHAAKGKEYPHVYVCGVEDGLFPHQRTSDVAGVEEERRLLFVACSRAEDTLTVTWARRRSRWGRAEDTEPSPFFTALPATVRRLHALEHDVL